ncbi:MAG: hypothetical protein M0P97_02290 [Candidatus Moranbacteria bacterium]|nr:hypothetical protein [Candidatus Moranbacteria bacterium]
MNILKIKIEQNKILLALEKDGKVLDTLEWKEENNLSQKLLEEIDNLLRKNGLSQDDLEKAEVVSDMSEQFTTRRIAESVAQALSINSSF